MNSYGTSIIENGDNTRYDGPNGISKLKYHTSLEQKPRLLLMGLKRSGKTSISNVVFRKMTPSDTIFLDTTTTIQKDATQ
ncbi:MAG: hypothetical protein Q9217_001289 [Psora testacea]